MFGTHNKYIAILDLLPTTIITNLCIQLHNNYYYQLPLQAKFSIETTAPTDIILLISKFSSD